MGLILPRNRLAFPGGSPGGSPGHPAWTPNLKYSGVAGDFRNLLTNVAPTVHGSPTYSITSVGPTMNFTGSTQWLSIPGAGGVVTAVTIGAIFVPFSTATSFGIIFDNNSAGSLGSAEAALYLNSSKFTMLDNGGGSTLFGALTYSANTPYFVAISLFSASLTGTLSGTAVFTNLLTGQTVSSLNSGAKAFNTQTGTSYSIGGGSSGLFPNAAICAVMYSTDPLTLGALQTWAQAPWDFWRPPTVRQTIFSSLAKVSTQVTGVGSANGSASVSGVGSSLAKSIGSSTGTAAVAGVGRTTAQSTGTSTATSSVAGVGAALIKSIGTAAGQAAVLGDAKPASLGIATGQGSALGISSAIILSVGTANGSADVEGIECVPVFSTVSAIGQADGQASVIGISLNVANSIGRADGTSSVLGIPKTTLVYTGTSDGVSFVQGISNQPAILFPGAILLAGL